MEQRIFNNYYFVLTQTCFESQMNDFFSVLYNSGCSEQVYKIECYPMGLLTYHSRIFSLNLKSPYQLLNSPNVSEDQIQNYLSKVGNGLYNLLFTLNCVPVIKYRTGWFAENVIKELQNVFDFTLERFPEVKMRIQSKHETLLVLLDRESDLPIMFHHPASLGGMMEDLFGVVPSKSKVSLSDSSLRVSGAEPLEIDPVEDYIWNTYCSSSYIETVEEIIKEELKKVSDETKFLDDNPNNLMSQLSGKSETDISKLSEKMSATLDNLKDIQMKKNILKNYAKYHTLLYSEVNKRHLGQFYMLEEEMLMKRNTNNEELKRQYFEILKEEKFKVDVDNTLFKLDVLRLTLIVFLTTELKTDEYKLVETLLTKLKIDMSALQFLKSKREFLKGLNVNSNPGSNGVFRKGFSYLVNRIGGMMTEMQTSLISDTVASLASGKSVEGYVDYSLLTKNKIESKGTVFTKVIVFVCGGGSLVEFESLDTFLSKKGKQVIYGSDKMYSPNEFVSEIKLLKQN